MRPVHAASISHKGMVCALAVGLAIGFPEKILAQSAWDQWARADDEPGPQVLLETATTRGDRGRP